MSIEQLTSKLNQRCFSFYRLLDIKRNCKISLKFHSSRQNKRIQNFCLLWLNSISLVVNIFRLLAYHTCPTCICSFNLTPPLLHPALALGEWLRGARLLGFPASSFLGSSFPLSSTIGELRRKQRKACSLGKVWAPCNLLSPLGSSSLWAPAPASSPHTCRWSHFTTPWSLILSTLQIVPLLNSPKILIGSCHLPLCCCQINHLSWCLCQFYKIFAPFSNRIFWFIEKENDLPKVTKLVSSWNSAILTLITMLLLCPALPPLTVII